MSRTIFKVEDFNSVVSSANAWESVKHHLDEMLKYHTGGALLKELKEQVSKDLFEDGHHGAATHFNCLIERLLDELISSKEEVEFLSNNLK